MFEYTFNFFLQMYTIIIEYLKKSLKKLFRSTLKHGLTSVVWI